MFWIGFLVGLFVGANIGIMGAALAFAGKSDAEGGVELRFSNIIPFRRTNSLKGKANGGQRQ